MTETTNKTARIRPLIIWPDPRLKTISTDVDEFNDELEQLANDMYWTMAYQRAIGLAAPQVGVFERVIVVQQIFEQETNSETNSTASPSYETTEAPITLVNPVIVDSDNSTFTWQEGCLSVPGYFEERERPNQIIVEYKDVHGIEHRDEFSGITSFCIQHEIDHLDGKCFVDDVSMLKRELIRRKIKAALRKRKIIQNSI